MSLCSDCQVYDDVPQEAAYLESDLGQPDIPKGLCERCLRLQSRVKDVNNYFSFSCRFDQLSTRSSIQSINCRPLLQHSLITTPFPSATPFSPAFADQWPTEGKIDIDGLSVKYRPELDFTLTNVTLSIPARAKVQSSSLRAASVVNLHVLCFSSF